MPSFAVITALQVNPEPAYPEYEQVRDQASAAGRFVDPAELPRAEEVVRRRGTTWCTAVLGFWFPSTGLRGITVTEARMLLAADQRQRLQQEAQHQRYQADALRWENARTGSDVPMDVRPNLNRRRAGVGSTDGALRHVVPRVDAQSGRSGKPRLHPADRALCETLGRVKHLRLGDPTDQPATCKRCLALTALIRRATPAGEPQPRPRASDQTYLRVCSPRNADEPAGDSPRTMPMRLTGSGKRISGYAHGGPAFRLGEMGLVRWLAHRGGNVYVLTIPITSGATNVPEAEAGTVDVIFSPHHSTCWEDDTLLVEDGPLASTARTRRAEDPCGPRNLPAAPDDGGAELYWDNDDNWAITTPEGAVLLEQPGFGDETGASVLVAVARKRQWRWQCLGCGNEHPASGPDICYTCETRRVALGAPW